MRLNSAGALSGRLLKLSLLVIATALLANFGGGRRARAYSAGPPASHTGAPSENNCTACHTSYPINFGLGSVSLGGLPLHYTPGEQLSLTITTEHPDGFLYGFQLTAIDSTGANAGSLFITDTDNVQLVSGFVAGHDRSYLEHTFDGAFPVEFNRRVWSFNWRAPAADIGPVTFYFTGNGANGDHETTGDYIYLSQRTFGCTGATPSSSSFDASAGNGVFSLSSGCSWTAVSQANWIHLTSPGFGSGDGSVSFSVDANPASTPRSGSILIGGISVPVLQGANFSDVDSGNVFYNYIGKISARGITLGCGGGNYCPNSNVTREQMAAFLMRSLGIPNPSAPIIPTFADVPPENIFYAFVEELARRGITQGCGSDSQGNRLYCPGSPVTREQMAAFVIRALGDFNPPTPAMQRFIDVPPANIFYAFIEEMAVRGITLGCGPGIYCPASPVTREQMAAFLVRGFAL